MYKPGDDKLEVRELLVKAFASAWEPATKPLTATPTSIPASM